jgi:hypothetical protein
MAVTAIGLSNRAPIAYRDEQEEHLQILDNMGFHLGGSANTEGRKLPTETVTTGGDHLVAISHWVYYRPLI